MPSYKASVENNACYVIVWISQAARGGQVTDDTMQSNKPFRALIDTGATRSCITEKVAKAINISPTSKAPMMSASGMKNANVYDISLSLPIAQVSDGGASEAIKTFLSLPVMEITDNESFDVILGMDFLLHCNFILAHGEFIISI